MPLCYVGGWRGPAARRRRRRRAGPQTIRVVYENQNPQIGPRGVSARLPCSCHYTTRMLPSRLALALLVACAAPLLVAADPSSDAAAACATLNLTEKLSLMSGVGPLAGYSRNSGCAGVCGRSTLRWDNGPQGFGDGCPPGSSTQWSSSLAMAATWDPDLALAWGTAMGEEFWAKGTNMQEGPGVNVARIQRNGVRIPLPPRAGEFPDPDG